MSSKSWTNLLIMKTNKALKSLKTISQQRSWCKNVKMNLIKSWHCRLMALLHLLQNKKKNMNYNNSTWMLKSKSIIRLPLVPVKLQFPFSKKKNKKILMLIKIKMTVRKSLRKILDLINKTLNLFNIIPAKTHIYYEN